MFINCKEKNCNFTVVKHSWHHFNYVIKITNTGNRAHWYDIHDTLKMTQLCFCGILAQTAQSKSIHEEISLDKPKVGTFYNVTDKYFSKLSRSWKTKAENCQGCEKIRETWELNIMWDPGLDPEQKNVIWNTNNIWIKSVV